MTIPLEVTAPAIDRAHATKAQVAAARRPPPKPAGQAGDRKARDTQRRMTIKGTARPRGRARGGGADSRQQLARRARRPTRERARRRARRGPRHGRRRRERRRQPGRRQTPARRTASAGSARSERARAAAASTKERLAAAVRSARWEGSAVQGGPNYGIPASGGCTRANPVCLTSLEGASYGTLDKEIIRRIVRRHLNEVRYCYQQALTRRPTLEGRLVTQFTIAPTGQVLAAVVQSSTLREVSVEAAWSTPSSAGSFRRRTTAAWRWSPIRSPSRRPATDRARRRLTRTSPTCWCRGSASTSRRSCW